METDAETDTVNPNHQTTNTTKNNKLDQDLKTEPEMTINKKNTKSTNQHTETDQRKGKTKGQQVETAYGAKEEEVYQITTGNQDHPKENIEELKITETQTSNRHKTRKK